jgi:hypothetical protein
VARLLIQGEWFDAVAAASMYENSYEGLLLANADELFPSFHAVRFKKRVRSELGNGEPDLALIDKAYRAWWVVEVELSNHPLRSHVEKQVAIFASARYGLPEANYLAEHAPNLDRSLLIAMMLGMPPRVLVLVNAARPEWASWLARYDALVGVAEVFRSDQNQHILRIDGELPRGVGDRRMLSICRRHPVLPKVLTVDSPASVVGLGDEPLPISYRGGSAMWAQRPTATNLLLMPQGRYPLPTETREFILLGTDDGSLEFIELGNGGFNVD